MFLNTWGRKNSAWPWKTSGNRKSDMRENVRYVLAKTAKWAAVVSLLGIIGVIAVHLLLRRPVPAESPVSPAPSVRQPGENVDRKEGVEHILFKGDRGEDQGQGR